MQSKIKSIMNLVMQTAVVQDSQALKKSLTQILTKEENMFLLKENQVTYDKNNFLIEEIVVSYHNSLESAEEELIKITVGGNTIDQNVLNHRGEIVPMVQYFIQKINPRK